MNLNFSLDDDQRVIQTHKQTIKILINDKINQIEQQSKEEIKNQLRTSSTRLKNC